jgi:DNA-binding transcriptional ArsR family regulator
VNAVAEATGISDVCATQCLRMLNSRGLLRARRVSRWVVYEVGHDPLVAGTALLVRALRRQLRGGDDAVKKAFEDATAFTHPRRVAIVFTLAHRGPMSPGTLRVATGISRNALGRHLRKLMHRGVVRSGENTYRLVRSPGGLLGTLVQIACD